MELNLIPCIRQQNGHARALPMIGPGKKISGAVRLALRPTVFVRV
jgi:hypothetical protein